MVSSITKKEDAILALAKNVANIGYEHIPTQAAEVAKMDILDTLGVAIAASSKAPACKKVVELVKEMGGKKESTIISYGGKVPSYMAAFANGALAHSLNYDDFHDDLGIHLGCSIFPAAFAIAERLGGVSGKEFITAYALSVDLESRLTRSVMSEETHHDWQVSGWLLPQVFGYFGAAAVAGRLLGFGEDQLVSTLGIAYSQVAGNMQPLIGSDADKGIYSAYPAKAGVLSALMAQRGIAGPKDVLEGKSGLYKVYFQGDYDPAPLITDLGKSFEVPGFFRFPCCSFTHLYTEVTLRMVDEHKIRHQDVEAITVFVSEKTRYFTCDPLQMKRNPSRPTDAQMSLPFVVATAIVKGKPRIEHFTSDTIKDPEVLRLSNKVSCQPGQEPSKQYGKGAQYAKIEIKLVDGRVLHSEQEGLRYGHPQRPISKEELVEKFRECACYSIRPLPKDSVEEVLKMVSRLEEVDDVSQIIQLVS